MVQVPTPLQKLSGVFLKQNGLEVYVKRDDLIHPEIMGNKWRKLKYNLEAMKHRNLTQMVTMGGAYSNHIAAVAAAAELYGFQSVGIIRGDELNMQSNHTLRLASSKGMKLVFVSREEYRDLRENQDVLKSQYQGSYVLPEGGTNDLAIKGCKEITDEIEIDFDVIVCPVGTGGTLSGIISTLKEHQKAIGVSSLKGSFIDDEIHQLLQKNGIHNSNYSINREYHFGGYAKSNSHLIDFIEDFKEKYSIQLDPIYTGKSFFGVWDMIKTGKFEKNLRIVLLHTGGLQGIKGFDRKSENIIQ